MSGGEAVLALPHLNAALNGTAAVLLLAGLAAVKTRRIALHKACMAAALLVSVAFLASYVVYHVNVPSRRFPGTGPIRAFYLVILVTHVVLAAAVPFLAITTAVRGLRERIAAHVSLARWTLPIWLYVSITGVVIYIMLYRLYPTPASG